jgi:hypothetical protein
MVIVASKISNKRRNNKQLTQIEQQHVNPVAAMKDYMDEQINPLVKLLSFDKLKWKLSKSAEAS